MGKHTSGEKVLRIVVNGSRMVCSSMRIQLGRRSKQACSCLLVSMKEGLTGVPNSIGARE